jgi:hypothetical protein
MTTGNYNGRPASGGGAQLRMYALYKNSLLSCVALCKLAIVKSFFCYHYLS